MNNTLWRKIGIYIFSIVVIAIDGAYFDLFSLLIPYLAVEYLKFSGTVSILRVMSVLIIHSALCFGSIRFVHLLIFAAYVVFVVTREYFLKPFFPFLLYNITVSTLLIVEGSFWVISVIVMILSLLTWRIKIEEA
ncbi:MAG: hypothetical protein ACK40Q_03720 [Pseudothermotoga sp.]